MDFSKDILQVIPYEEIPQLRDYYKNCCAPYIYTFIDTSLKWKKKKPDKEYITFYAPHGDWRCDGTFIAHLQFFCYDFLPFTMEDSCRRLYDGFTKTKRFDYLDNRMVFYCIRRRHIACIHKVVETMKILVDNEDVCDIWSMPREEALNLTVEVPPETYLRKLTPNNIVLVDNVWPHRYPGSVKHLEITLEMGTGYGLFLKSDNSLASWLLMNQMGWLGNMQTVDKHKRKGYSSVLMNYLSKEIAQKNGYDIFGTVSSRNTPSQRVLSKLGFKILGRCIFIECRRSDCTKKKLCHL